MEWEEADFKEELLSSGQLQHSSGVQLALSSKAELQKFGLFLEYPTCRGVNGFLVVAATGHLM